MNLQYIFGSKAGLKKMFVCRHPTLGLFGRNFLFFTEGLSRSQGIITFRYKFGREKKPFSATVALKDRDKWTRWYYLTREPQKLEALKNAFIVTFRCKFYSNYVYIFFNSKKRKKSL